MGFSDSQMRALARSVPARHVSSRVRDGKELSYVEGWYVLAQANRIFGFDGWDRETIETKCLLGREARGSFTAVYSARVRITVRTPGGTVIRDGHGTGEAHGGSAGEVHDRALKAAETDATKRALATFGKAFGLALYAGGASVTARRHPQNDTAQTAQASPAQRTDGGQPTNGGQPPAQVTSTLPSPEGTAGNGQSERGNGDAHPDHRCDSVGGCHSARVNRAASERVLGHHQRPYPRSPPIHRQECPASSRTTPCSRQGASALRRVAAMPALQRHAVRRPSCPLRPATRHGPQSQ